MDPRRVKPVPARSFFVHKPLLSELSKTEAKCKDPPPPPPTGIPQNAVPTLIRPPPPPDPCLPVTLVRPRSPPPPPPPESPPPRKPDPFLEPAPLPPIPAEASCFHPDVLMLNAAFTRALSSFESFPARPLRRPDGDEGIQARGSGNDVGGVVLRCRK